MIIGRSPRDRSAISINGQPDGGRKTGQGAWLCRGYAGLGDGKSPAAGVRLARDAGLAKTRA